MFKVRALFQWERFITPSIIRVFYALAVLAAVSFGISRLIAAIGILSVNPVEGGIMAVASIVGTLMAILLARIGAELVLITFRISDHLGAIRARAEM